MLTVAIHCCFIYFVFSGTVYGNLLLPMPGEASLVVAAHVTVLNRGFQETSMRGAMHNSSLSAAHSRQVDSFHTV